MERDTDWADCEGEEATAELVRVAKDLYRHSASRRTIAASRTRRFFGLSPVADWTNTESEPEVTNPLNVFRSLVNTLVANVGAIQTPKVQFVTSDADWSVRRRAKKLDQLIEAVMCQPCPPCSSLHEMRTLCLRDACVYDDFGGVQVRIFPKTGGIVIERVLPWEVLVDDMDARAGNPCQWIRYYPLSRSTLKAWFPSKAQVIDDGETYSDDSAITSWYPEDSTRGARSDDYAAATEVWRVSIGDKKGRHLLCLSSGEPLIDEEYDSELCPFARIVGDYPLVGGHTRSIMSDAIPVIDELNELMSRMQESIRRTAMGQTFVMEGSIDPKDMAGAADAQNYVYYQGTTPPTTVNPEPFGAPQYQFLQFLLGQCGDITGVSQMAQTGEAPKGLSGAAMREVNAVQSKRFAQVWRQVEQWSIQVARLIVEGLRRAYDNDNDFSAKWAGGQFLREIKWSEASLDDDQFIMQIYPANELHGTPAERSQNIEDLFARGLISPSAYVSAMQTPLDTDRARKAASRQEAYLEKLIDQFLDATDEDIERGYFDEEETRPVRPAPLKWMDLGAALSQVAVAYMDAELDGAPDEIKRLFAIYMEQIDQELQAQQQRMAAMQQGAEQPAGQGQPAQ